MAYLTGQEYDRRREAAATRMERQREITTLTEEQHDALAALCSLRHRIHSDHRAADSLFCTGSGDYDEYWQAMQGMAEDFRPMHYVFADLMAAGLPRFRFSEDGCGYCNDMDWNDDEYEDDDGTVYPAGIDQNENENLFWEKYEACKRPLYALVEDWNWAVEQYLQAIDEAHGTSYAPTGAQRI